MSGGIGMQDTKEDHKLHNGLVAYGTVRAVTPERRDFASLAMTVNNL
jgi:hypothetical protein